MATQLDEEIEQLENIVEKCLDLYRVTRNGIRCTLPASHEQSPELEKPEVGRAFSLAGCIR